MAEITFLGTEYSDVPAVTLPQTGGGTVTFYEDGLELVKSLDPITVKLSATDFATWTPSTTAKAMYATQSVGTFTAEDVADYDYFVRQRIYTHVVYNSGTSTAKGMFQLSAGENWNCITRRASNAANLNSGTLNQTINESITTVYAQKYYNTAWTVLYSSGYGFYPGNTAQAISSTSAASPTITVKTAVINARCNATYFSTGMAAAVDQDESTIKFVIDVYKAHTGYMRKPIWESITDMWRNGL